MSANVYLANTSCIDHDNVPVLHGPTFITLIPLYLFTSGSRPV